MSNNKRNEAESSSAEIEKASTQKMSGSNIFKLGGLSRKAIYLKRHWWLIGVIALLSLGALGASLKYLESDAQRVMRERSQSSPLNPTEETFLSKVNPFLPAPPAPQLSKEYIYAGSRLLAVEDAGAGQGNPTPTPTPTPTLTPTPTPVPPPSCPTGFTSLGGWINADPSASVFGNKLFVFVKGGDDAFYFQTTLDGNFSGWFGLGGYLISNPASAVVGSTLYVEGTGGNNSRYYQATNDGVNFSGWVGGTVNAQTNPATYFNGNTYTFVKGSGSQPPLCVKIEAGGTPPPPPTPAITSVATSANSACLNLTLDGVAGATSYDVRILNSGYTINTAQLSFPWCGLQPSTYYEYQARAVNAYGSSGWSNTAGGTTATPPPTPTPTPVPETYQMSASVLSANKVQINWTASVTRPANTDLIKITFGSNSSNVVYSEYTQGGTSGQFFFSPRGFGSGNFTVRYLKNGTTQVAGTSFYIDGR